MGSEKQFPATAKKLKDAREKGDVSKSREFSGACLLFVGLIYLVYSYPGGSRWFEVFRKTLSLSQDFHTETMLVYLKLGSQLFFEFILPFILLQFISALLVEMFQVGFVVSAQALSPKLSRLNFFEGCKRICGFESEGKGGPLRIAYEMAKLTLYLLCGGVVFWMIGEHFHWFLKSLFGFSAFELNELVWLVVLYTVMPLSILFILISRADAFVQEQRRRERLKMDAQELKREFKEQEGDAEVKSMRKHLYREILLENMVEAVKKARVLVVSDNR